MAVVPNKYSFCQHLQLTPFCIKTNPRENRFFAWGGNLVNKMGTHEVKIYAEKQTNYGLLTTLC